MYNFEERKENEKQIVIKEYPYSIAVEVSARCNLKCIMCENPNMKRKKGDMSWETFRKIADDAKQYPDLRFWINGYGESLLNKNVYGFIRYATDVGIRRTYLNTNAMLLDEEASCRLIDGGLGCLVVSLDGMRKETYERVRIGGNRDLVFQNVSRYLEILKEKGQEEQIVEVQIIEMEETKDEIDEFVDYWTSKGAHVKLKPLLTWGNVKETDIDVPTERLACNFCNMMQIMWDGTIPYCSCGDCELKWKVGNIMNGSIAEFWKKKSESFCRFHLNHEFDKLPEFCQECSDWSAQFAKHLNENKEETFV